MSDMPRRQIAGRPICSCVGDINADLKRRDLNTEVTIELFSGAVVVRTDKLVEKVRKKPVVAVASYCPFCGKRYVDDEATEAAHA